MSGGYGQKLTQLWNDWQLSILVLLSLCVQLLLLITAGIRRRAQPSQWIKMYFWSLYIGSRSIAIYALGILSRASRGDANADIQAFWAALLLFHLGGPDDFTALSLEDNKLWDRRCFELIIEVSTTLYVFVRYFLDLEFRRFILPFALIFSAGVVKYIEQVVALRQATMEALIESILGTPDAGPDYADTMDRVNGILRSGALPSLNIGNERVDRPNPEPPEVHQMEERRQENQQQAMKIIRSAHTLFLRFSVLFADGIFSFNDRRKSQVEFLNKDATWAFKVVEIELSFVYDRLYTKSSVSRSTRLIVRVISLGLTLAGSLCALFATLDASQYRLRHRCVTYTLLAGAVLTDIALLATYTFSIWSLVHSNWLECCSDMLVNRRRWSGQMAQSNLITFCLENLPSKSELLWSVRRQLYVAIASGRRNLTPLPPYAQLTVLPYAELAAIFVRELQGSDSFQKYFERPSLLEQLRSRNFWRKYDKPKHVPVREELIDFIFRQIRKKETLFNNWERKRRTTSSSDNHNPFTAFRGDLVMTTEGIEDLDWCLQQREFDESLLIWHIGTDLLFREEHDQEDTQRDANTRKHMEIGREISNYMYYIMVVHPLMLSSSTTMATKRSRDTCAEAWRHFLRDPTCTGDRAVSEANAHDSLLRVDTPLHASVVKGDRSKSVLWDGCILARELRKIEPGREPGRRWRVVCEVWVEMLCYAAVHCGGYQHAERLKDGGELITFVCLLMTHLGMGKHYRTEVGDAYAYLSPYNAA